MSPTKQMLHSFLDSFFPTSVPADDGAEGEESMEGVEEGGESVKGVEREVPELVAMKEQLHDAVEALQLPPNFLDLLIDQVRVGRGVAGKV